MIAPVLEAEGLVKEFVAKRTVFGRATATVKAVDGVSLSLMPGETLAIVGESGCGKSTLGRLLLRLIEPTEGRVRLAGVDLLSLGESELRRQRRNAQLIFQDPFASLNPRMSVGDILAEPLMLHRTVPTSDRRRRVAELLELVGLQPQHATRYPHEFSGGQRQRIVIARALAAEPKVVVCDEPVSALDVSIRAQILNLLRDLQQRLSLSYIFISHDLGAVKHIADRIAVMYLGRIVELAASETLFAEPRHPYTQALLSAIPVAAPGAKRERCILEGDVPSPLRPPSGCHLHTRCRYAVDRCSRERPALAAGPDGHATACHRWRELPPQSVVVPAEAKPDERLQRLMAAFDAGVGEGGGTALAN